jgi:hypothetical protein
LIEELQKEAKANKTEADKQKRLADDAKGKEEALAAELRKSVNLTVYQKGFLPAIPSAGLYQDQITIACAYENTSPKDIRAFKGAVVFKDLVGVDVYNISLTISDPVNAGAQAKWNGSLQFNQFVLAQKRFRDTELKDMTVRGCRAQSFLRMVRGSETLPPDLEFRRSGVSMEALAIGTQSVGGQ